MIEVSSVVLFASDLADTVAFYRAVGVPLVDEDHDGELHAATEVGPVHVAVYQAEVGVGAQAPAWRSAAGDFLGFYVDSLDEVRGALTGLDAPLLTDHQIRPWGCRFVAQDPDGRPVEVNQRDHCS